MSRAIDEKVVELRFDNSQFESGAKTSLNTLDKLKQGLNFDSAQKSVGGLSSIFAKLNLGKVGEAVETVGSRFTTLGIIATTAIQNITNKVVDMGLKLASAIPKQIISGGIKRAFNIENARFMLQGLIKNGKAVQEVMDKAMDSVNGTAYGYDEAAKAAAQFTASGLTAAQLEAPLRAIAGTAAMTNAEYEDISRIFTTVAGNGRLMGDQLIQLSSRGLNAKATIRDFVNSVNDGSKEVSEDVAKVVKDITHGKQVTEADIQELVSKGKISFELFSAAFDDAFGEHAKKANETFTGSLANMKAALSRIGADFISPLVEQNGPLVKMFNALRVNIDEVRKQLKPFVVEFTSFVSSITNSISKITKTTIKDGKYVEVSTLHIKELFDGLKNVLHGVTRVVYQVKKAFKNVFPKSGIDRINDAIDKFNSISDAFSLSKLSDMMDVRTIFEGFFNVLKLGGQILGTFKDALFKIFPPRESARSIFELATSFGEFLKSLKLSGGTLLTIQRTFQGFFAILDIGRQIIVALAKYTLKPLIGDLGNFSGSLLESAGSFGEWLTNLSKSWKETDFFGQKIKGITDAIKDFKEKILGLWIAFHDGFEKMTGIDLHIPTWEELVGIFEDLKSKLEPVNTWLGKVKDKFDELIDSISQYITYEGVVDFFYNLGEALGSIGECIGKVAGYIAEIFSGLGKSIGDFFSSLDSEDAQGLFSGVTSAGVLGALLIIVRDIDKFLYNIKSALGMNGEGGLAQTAIETLNSIKSTLIAFQNELKASSLMKIAFGIAALAIAVSMLASIDQASVYSATAVLAAIMGELYGFMEFVAQLEISKSQLQALGTALLLIGIGFLALAAAIKVLSTIDMPGIGKGILVMAAALGGLAGAAVLINKFGSNKALLSLSVALIALGNAMILLAGAFLLFNFVSWEAFGKGMLVMAGAIYTLTAAALVLDKSHATTSLLALSVALVALGAAMIELSIAFLIFNKVSMDALIEGMLVLAGSIFVLTNAANAISASKSEVALLALSVALVSLGSAMIALATAFVIFNKVSPAAFVEGMLVMVGAIISLTLAAEVIKSSGAELSLIALAGAMAILGAAMIAFAVAMKIFDTVSWEGLTKGLVIFVIALGSLLAIAAMFGPVVPAMLGVAAAMLMLGVSVAAIGAGMLLISAAFALFVATLLLLAGVSALTAAAIVTALEIIVVGAIQLLPILAKGIADFFIALIIAVADSIDAILQAVSTILVAIFNLIISLVPKIGELIAVIIVATCQAIIDSAPKIAEAIKVVLLETIAVLNEVIPALTDMLFQVLVALYEQCVEYIPQIVTLFIELIIGILNAISEKIGDVVDAAYDIVIAFMEAIGEKIPEVVETGIKMVIDLVNGIAQAIEDHTEEMQQAIERLITAMLNMGIAVIQGMINPFMKKGEELMNNGLIQGIAKFVSKVWDTIKGAVQKAVDKVKTFVSKFRAKGEEIMNSGLVQGIKGKVDAIWKFISDGIQKALNKVREFVSKFRSVGRNIMDGLAGGISGAVSAVIRAVTGAGGAALSAIKSILGIHSPSKEFAWVGEMSMQGFADGIKSMTSVVAKESAGVGKTAIDEMSESLNMMDGYFHDMDFEPSIRPVVDMSEVKQASDELASIFTNPVLRATATDASAALTNRGTLSDYAMATETGNKKLLEAMNIQNDALSRLYERVDKLQVCLDSGELVGGIVEKMDNAFGTRTMRQMRSN